MQAFEAAGVWWLPSSPDNRVVGNLSFERGSGFRLEIPAGALGSQEEMVERLNRMGALGSSLVGDVMGVLKDGRHVALFDSHGSGFSMSVPGMTSESYVALRGLVGDAHLDRSIKVDTIGIQATLLRDWVGESDLAVELSFGEDDRPTGALAVKRNPTPKRVLFQTDELTVSVTHIGGLEGDPTHGLTVRHDCRLCVDLESATSVQDVVEAVVSPVVYFLTFAMGCPIGVEKLEVSCGPDADTSELYFTHLGRTSIPERRLDPWMLAPLFSTKANVARLLENWLALDGDLGHAAILTADLAARDEGTVNYRLLLAAQALESVHRGCMNRAEVAPEEFKSRLAGVLAACDEKRIRSWLKRKLQYSNLKPLETQLRELYSFAGPAAKRIAPDRDRFLRDLRKSRNFFAHGGSMDDSPLDLGDVYVLTQAATQLLRSLLLRVLGLKPDDALSLLLEDQSFVQSCVQTARLYEIRASE